MTEPREELRQLAASLRARADLLAESGATGVPRAARSRARSSGAERLGQEAGVSDTRSQGSPGPAAETGPRAAVPVSGGASAEGDPRRLRLAELEAKVRACRACALAKARTQTVFSRGDPGSELCFVGEGPGADEDAQGQPFVGKAGQLLDRMISAMGFARDEVYICNIVKCRPPNNRKPEPAEMSACSPFLAEQLGLVNPKVIVALGATAVEGLLGPIGGITRVRGQWRLYQGKIPVMPTFHPAYLLRNPAAKKDVWLDLQSVVKQLGRKLPSPAVR